MVASIFIMEIDFSAIGNKKKKTDMKVIGAEELMKADKEVTSEQVIH